MSTSDTALESLDTMVYDADHAITRLSTFVDYSVIILSSFVLKLAYHAHGILYNLDNMCWLSVDQNFFGEKYEVSAFKRRIKKCYT